MDEMTIGQMIKQIGVLREFQRRGLDEKGNPISDTYYKVVLEPPLVDGRYKGLYDWIHININHNKYVVHWVTDFYFENEEDAVAFKLRWH